MFFSSWIKTPIRSRASLRKKAKEGLIWYDIKAMKKSLNEVYFADNASSCPEELEKMANALLEHIVSFMKLKKPLVLSCTIVDDAEIWKINKEYRKIDRPTDVISFAYDDDKSDEGEGIDDRGEI